MSTLSRQGERAERLVEIQVRYDDPSPYPPGFIDRQLFGHGVNPIGLACHLFFKMTDLIQAPSVFKPYTFADVNIPLPRRRPPCARFFHWHGFVSADVRMAFDAGVDVKPHRA